jgi:MFS family permease
MIVGAPLIAFIAEKLKAHYSLAIFCGIGMSLLLCVIIFLHNTISPTVLYLLMFLVGVFCCYQVLVLTIGFASVSHKLTGITVAFMNCINMLGGSLFHSIIGNALDYFWQGQTANNIRVYDIQAYDKSMLIIPLASFLGSLLFLIVRFNKSFYIKNKLIMEK